MNSTPTLRALVLAASVLALTVGSSFAQQITGTPGSPSATTTIDGKYLPPPPAPFGGTINLDAQDSKRYWPPSAVMGETARYGPWRGARAALPAR